MIPVAPWFWTLFWQNYYSDTKQALIDYGEEPDRAAAATWHITDQWPWMLVVAVAAFLIYLPIWWYARPARDRTRDPYS